MSEKYLTEKISFYKLWIALFVVMDSSTMAWFFNNADKISLLKVFLSIGSIILITCVILMITIKTRKMIKKLEELK